MNHCNPDLIHNTVGRYGTKIVSGVFGLIFGSHCTFLPIFLNAETVCQKSVLSVSSMEATALYRGSFPTTMSTNSTRYLLKASKTFPFSASLVRSNTSFDFQSRSFTWKLPSQSTRANLARAYGLCSSWDSVGVTRAIRQYRIIPLSLASGADISYRGG